MEEEEGGLRLSKRFSDQGGEVDLKTKSGTAWSHNFLNQKPWHPLSYPNQRRKWIAEQTHAQRERRADEVAREVNHPSLSFYLIRLSDSVSDFVQFDLPNSLFFISGPKSCLQFAQEQEFFRQTALVSKKEKEKVILKTHMQIHNFVCILWSIGIYPELNCRKVSRK